MKNTNKIVSKKCGKCNQVKTLDEFHKNKDGFLGRRSNCKICCKIYRRTHYENNMEKSKRSDKQYREKYPEKNRAKRARYRASKLKATPIWADKDRIDYMYKKAKWLEELTGKKYEVDHIVPLQSNNVCGLHCWANLQILEVSHNRSKGNKHG